VSFFIGFTAVLGENLFGFTRKGLLVDDDDSVFYNTAGC
jgi:hypothetical protein